MGCQLVCSIFLKYEVEVEEKGDDDEIQMNLHTNEENLRVLLASTLGSRKGKTEGPFQLQPLQNKFLVKASCKNNCNHTPTYTTATLIRESNWKII